MTFNFFMKTTFHITSLTQGILGKKGHWLRRYRCGHLCFPNFLTDESKSTRMCIHQFSELDFIKCETNVHFASLPAQHQVLSSPSPIRLRTKSHAWATRCNNPIPPQNLQTAFEWVAQMKAPRYLWVSRRSPKSQVPIPSRVRYLITKD